MKRLVGQAGSAPFLPFLPFAAGAMLALAPSNRAEVASIVTAAVGGWTTTLQRPSGDRWVALVERAGVNRLFALIGRAHRWAVIGRGAVWDSKKAVEAQSQRRLRWSNAPDQQANHALIHATLTLYAKRAFERTIPMS